MLVLFLSLCFSYTHFRSILCDPAPSEPGGPCQRRFPGGLWMVA